MKTFKQHIYEKLKVSKSSLSIITYQQFADMLDEYCAEFNVIGLTPGRIISNYSVEKLPPFLLDKGYVILIRPYYDLYHDCNQLIITYSKGENSDKKYWSLTLDKNVLERQVNFISDEWVEKLYKYMEDLVKT